MLYVVYAIENGAGRILRQGDAADAEDLSGQAEDGEFFAHIPELIEEPDQKYIANPASDESPIFESRPRANRHDRLSVLGNGGRAPFNIVRGPHPAGTEIRAEANRTYAVSVYDGGERPIRVMNQGRLQLHITPPFPEISTSYQVNIDTGDMDIPGPDHEADPAVKELVFSPEFEAIRRRHGWQVKPVYFVQALQTIQYNGAPAIEAVDEFMTTRPEWRRQFEAMSSFYRLGQEINRWLGDAGDETGLGMSQDKLDEIFRYAVQRQGHDDRHPDHFVYDFIDADPVEVE